LTVEPPAPRRPGERDASGGAAGGFLCLIEGARTAGAKQVEIGDAILICDVGGGTTDLTLIAVGEEDGNLALSRVAVGDHILLAATTWTGPAHTVTQQLATKGTKLDAGQQLMLWHGCRSAKEKLFHRPGPCLSAGDGRRPGSQRHRRHDQERAGTGGCRAGADRGVLPQVQPGCVPQRSRAAGLQELGCRTPAIRE